MAGSSQLAPGMANHPVSALHAHNDKCMASPSRSAAIHVMLYVAPRVIVSADEEVVRTTIGAWLVGFTTCTQFGLFVVYHVPLPGFTCAEKQYHPCGAVVVFQS